MKIVIVITKHESCLILRIFGSFTYLHIRVQYLHIGRVANRVSFVEELLYALMNFFIYYKTLTIHLDNIAAIIFQKTLNLFDQERGKRLQVSQ